jgi:hypothetical protein
MKHCCPKKKETAKNVLEIGVYDGGSIKMWHDYFTNANVYGLDIIKIEDMWSEIRNKERIILGRFDAYDENFINSHLSDKKFDFMLDDGPHSLESMLTFIRLYSQLMEEDGILIIEDVQSWDWIQTLKNAVPDHLKQYVKVYDLRPIKNRYDDIVFTIDKSSLSKPAGETEVVTEPEVISEIISDNDVGVFDEPEDVSEVLDEPEAVSEVVDEPKAVSEVVDEPEAVSEVEFVDEDVLEDL